MRFLFILSLCCATLAGQSFSISPGFKIGAPINEPSGPSSLFTDYRQGRWTGGPSIELRLPRNFAVEFDALYRTSRQTTIYPLRFDLNASTFISTSKQENHAWDLPLMLKYRFRLGSARPFVSAGYQWTHESREGSSFLTCSGPADSCLPAGSPFFIPSGGVFKSTYDTGGPIVGAGIEFRTRYVTISPEVRFTRPTNGSPRDNRFTGMVGFSFGGK